MIRRIDRRDFTARLAAPVGVVAVSDLGLPVTQVARGIGVD